MGGIAGTISDAALFATFGTSFFLSVSAKTATSVARGAKFAKVTFWTGITADVVDAANALNQARKSASEKDAFTATGYLAFGVLVLLGAKAAVAKGVGTASKRAFTEGLEEVFPDIVRPLSQAERKAVTRIDNIIRDHLKPGPKGDLSGTLRDMVGNPVPKPGGGFWQHTKEMNDTLRGLQRHAETLQCVMDPAGEAARQKALDAIKEINEFTKGAGL